MKTIISFIGLNGSGKTTAAKNLKEIIESKGKKVEILSLADPLKRIAERNCGYDEEKKRDGHREILLKLGSDIRTYLGDEVFVYACLDKIATLSADYVIIDDMRWFIEADIISAFNELHILKIDPIGIATNLEEYHKLNELTKELEDADFQVHMIPNYENSSNIPFLEEFIEELEG